VTTNEDAAKAITLTATDAEGSPLTYTVVTQPTHGTLTGTAPALTYTPAANYNGPDSFTFKANDGTVDSSVATVSITVTAVNDAPVAGNDSYTTKQGKVLTVVAPGVLANDSDIDSPTITAVVATAPAHGTLVLNANGGFSFTPAAGYSGPDSFTYRATDGVLTSAVATATIAITVNRAPTAASQQVTAQFNASALPIVLTASDLDGDPLTYRITVNPLHGTITGTAPNVVYKPTTGYAGNDTFKFVANDGSVDSLAATVSIRVLTATDRAPEAQEDWVFMDEDTTSPFALSAADPEGDPLYYRVVTQPGHGRLTGVAPNLTYTPDANFNGWDLFTFVASDGLRDSNVATMNFWVYPVNDPPVAANVQVQTSARNPVTGQLLVTDAENDWLYYMVVTPPAFGVVTVDSSTGAFTYTPGVNNQGQDQFSYTAYDSEEQGNVATVQITVTSPPKP
jgi:hypothetical protein